MRVKSGKNIGIYTKVPGTDEKEKERVLIGFKRCKGKNNQVCTAYNTSMHTIDFFFRCD